MTEPREPRRTSPWVIIPVVMAMALALGDFGDRFWGLSADSRITAYQVAQLTAAVRDLASKFDGAPRQAAIDTLTLRQDRTDTAISVLQQAAAALRADVENLLHPQIRNPR